MDTFIDKLAQKFTAGEVIKGNAAAEAKEIAKLREQVENYENLLQEMKLVNLKNMESAQKVADLAESSIESVKQICEGSSKEAGADKEYVSELFDKTNDTIHKENIRVYRNVQAAVNDGLEAQTKSILDKQDEIAKQQGLESKSHATFTTVISIVTLVAVLADIAINVLRILHIL